MKLRLLIRLANDIHSRLVAFLLGVWQAQGQRIADCEREAREDARR